MASAASEEWVEVGDRVFVRRHRSLDLNCGAVVGSDAVLVVDTRCHAVEAADLLAAVRRLSRAPVVVVNTHAHFDHCFGNSVFLPAPLWGHRGCASDLGLRGEAQRQATMRAYPSMAPLLAAVPITPPDHLVEDPAVVSLGDVSMELFHVGRGHTDHDLCVRVSSAGCVFAGDLLKEGAPPAYDDAWPVEWPDTVSRLLSRSERVDVVVPGHGGVMGREAALAQQSELKVMAALCSAVVRGDLSADDAVRSAPFPPSTARTAVSRAVMVSRA